jgi:hypothetical protein
MTKTMIMGRNGGHPGQKIFLHCCHQARAFRYSCVNLSNVSSNDSGPIASNIVNLPPNYAFGLNLNEAPQIEESMFVGREPELTQMHDWLCPSNRTQNVVAVSGLGGMGKTQLCIHFARRFEEMYSSIFWLNAMDESTLKAGLVNLARRIVDDDSVQAEYGLNSDESVIERVRQWLSKPENNKWLVIYDNYDDPDIPGLRSATGYDLRRFLPHRQQGSILITTRVSRLTFAKQLKLCPLGNIQESLMILANRSGREAESGKGSCAQDTSSCVKC